MSKGTKTHDAYVREVADNTLQYVQELQKEAAELRACMESLAAENARLHSVIDARCALVTEQYACIERQNADLANLYVASYRLHETLERQEVISAIQEIVVSLIGSEQLGIFELSSDHEALNLLWSIGINEVEFRAISRHAGIIGKAVNDGEIFMADGSVREDALPREKELTACVPLVLAGSVTGAIAIFGLLPQKQRLNRVDRELCELLATHAAMALYCTELHARAIAVGIEQREREGNN